MESNPKKRSFLPAVIAVVILLAAVAVIAYAVRAKHDADVVATPTPTPVAEATPTPVPLHPTIVTSPVPALADITSKWKVYTDAASGFSFRYPATLTVNGTEAKGAGMHLSVTSQLIDKIPDAAMWYGPDAAKEEQAALAKGSLDATKDADMLLKFSDASVGATNLVFQELSCDSVMFLREAHIYHNGYQIILGLEDNNGQAIIAGNPAYFGVDTACSGASSTDKTWTDAKKFGTDVAAGLTDTESQEWYSTFQIMLATVTFK